MKLLLISCICLCSFQAIAQTKPADTIKYATVNVTVTDPNDKPRKNEQIVFWAQNSNKVFSGRSNAAGILSLKLPAGDDYMVTVKTMSDTTQFGVISIPPLQKNQVYTNPFKVGIVYEPAHFYTLNNVEFDFGKATLRPSSYKELDELADYMKWKDEQKMEIAGHTDNVGKDADNMKLSLQRAEAVRSYLIKKGIKAERIIAKGYGATEPVAGNDSEEGRQKNRRTEARLL
jgi:OOP family OmpA-OmpF porin